jgi:intein/homing endonuclease
MGYRVLVVGQEVRHDEYGLYYKKILDAGANIIPTPSDSEKFEILGNAKIAMGFSFTQEIDEPVEYCFPAGTNVVVQNGDYGPNGNPNVSTRQYNGCGWYKIKKIENMSYGDKVLSYDSKSWKKCSDDVEKISVRKTDSIVYLKFSNGNEIRTTSNHPFAVMNGKGKFNWIHVSELKVGDKVIQYKYDGFARDINNILKKGKTPQHLINNDVRRKAEVTKKNNIEYQNKLKDNASKLGCISGPINQKYCNTIEARKKKSLSQKNNFKDPEFCKRWGKLHHVKPSGLEVRYMSMLDEWFPELWEYVGNFELMIDGKNPDFRLKDSNKIIELNGTYWHQGENDEEVMSFYKNNGWDCLVIWDHEIDDRAKVENFMHNPNVEIIEVSYISNDWRSEEIGNIKSKFELIYKNGLFSVWNRGNVYTVEKGFENVGKLRTKCFDDVIKFIDNIKDKTIDVYNLEVKNNHNFYANGILVHNSNLECINMGCYPIVANWQKRYFDDAGFSFNSIESPAAAPQYIDRMFSDNEYYIGCCKYNISVLDNYSRQFGVRFEKFVSELKNRVNCSNCGAIIPVRSMYCAICGKK